MTLLATARAIWAGQSECGPVRAHNEDAWAWASDHRGALLFVVVDGGGGFIEGPAIAERAWRAALDAFAKSTPSTVEQRLREVMRAAATAAHTPGEDRDFGSASATVAAVLIETDGAAVAHVGDVRVYLDGTPITTDHRLGELMIAQGKVTRAEARTLPIADIITRALGEPEVEIEVAPLTLAKGQRLVICSDGIHDGLVDEAIAEILDVEKTPEDAVIALIEEAIKGGSRDNLTAVVVDLR